ncbi:MAG: tRNA (adenosine(37)-N6)-threonylcarbamoyltransferase complex ATPase subunit type 1 TsaE [Bacteroidota bacterium]|nr:tRNA (adenosine(37)-N6)-threonylcarbamoyltransferase complex ATPase subunit type 1 TsaE [Bacteroidota bacterium]
MKSKTEQTVLVKSPEELNKAAKELIDFKEDNKVFAFYGEMGAGKTSFIKSICKELGVKDNVTSPTFSIVNEYLTSNNDIIYHFDFYRIDKESEAYDLGFEDYLYSHNYCFIEWPEKIAGLLPKQFIRIEIVEEEQGNRMITFQK